MVRRNHIQLQSIYFQAARTLSQYWQALGPLNAGLKKYQKQKILRNVSYRLPCNNFELKTPTVRYTIYKIWPLPTLQKFHQKLSDLHLVGPFFSFYEIKIFVWKVFWIAMCGKLTLTTVVYIHMISESKLSLIVHRLKFSDLHLVGPLLFSVKLET